MITPNDIRAELELACRDAGGQRAFARQVGLSAAYVNGVLTGRMPPGPGVLEPLGLKAVTVYVPLTEEELAALRLAHTTRVAESDAAAQEAGGI